MKLTSLAAGAFCVLLLMAAQNVSAQNSNTLPPPDREGSALPAPDREGSVLPAPSMPERAPVAAAQPVTPPSSPPKAAAAAGSDAGSQASGGSEQRAAAPSQAQSKPAKAKKTLPAKGLFIGAMIGPVFHFYDTDDTDMNNYEIDGQGSFGGGLYFGMDFGLLTGQAEILVAGDSARMEIDSGYPYYNHDEIKFGGTSLLIPLIFKLDLHLGPVVLQPLAGPYLNFALGDLEEKGDYSDSNDPYANPLFGLMFGGTLGIKAGPGMIFLDTRYAMDLGKTKAGNNPLTIWKRSGVLLNLGYQFYFGGKK
jgi:hypothetical protein